MASFDRKQSTGISRRSFVKAGAAGMAAGILAPAIVTADKTESGTIVGDGDYRYEALHDFVRLPDPFKWQTTHNVAVDREGLVYVIHEGLSELKDHPAIFVFDADGKYVRSFGQQFQGGGHGLEVRTEGNEQFLYITAYQGLKFFSKLTLTGETVWNRHAPMESGLYATGEDSDPQPVWGRDRFMPTNIAFCDDGGFFVADGYGTWCIHEYDDDANWKSTFGGPGEDSAQFSLPHGIWTDQRPEREPSLVIADRQHGKLKWFSLDGRHQHTLSNFLLPANVATHEGLMVVPELQARVTLLGPDNSIVARLGDDATWREQVLANEFAMRNHPDQWQPGKFIHPHDACFDHEGNILIAEWVATGRVTKLKRLN